MIETRRLGTSELHLTTIGVGTWAMGGAGWKFSWGAQDDGDSIAAIHRALDRGINWIDTAPVYGLGHSEEVVGKAIKKLSKPPIVATKCGRRWDQAGAPYGDIKRSSILEEVDQSLRRLGMECIDLYQLHWPMPDEDIEEAWAAMAECVRAGKVRYIGVSNCSVAQLKRLMPIHPITSIQPPYSMLVRDIELELLPFCQQNGIGVVCYSPIQKGILSDKFTRAFAEGLPPDDHRRNDSQFQEPKLSRNLSLLERLGPIARESNRSIAQLAIQWVLRRAEITSAIVGARNPEQFEEIAAAASGSLTESIIRSIDAELGRA